MGKAAERRRRKAVSLRQTDCYDRQAAKGFGAKAPEPFAAFLFRSRLGACPSPGLRDAKHGLGGEPVNEVLRQEKKYLMNLVSMKRLSGQLAQVMIEDPHNGAEGYCVRSLYFDTLRDTDYEEKLDGLELRRKIRLRIYAPGDSFAMLEMKQKQGSRQKKRSLRVSREDAAALTRGRYDCLLRYPDPFAAECYGLMHCRCYRPKTVVEYRRKAFIAKENKIRITFDHQIRATETCGDLFSPVLNMNPVLDPFNGVLEVKYNGFLLTYLKNLVNEADRSELSVSKYCLARSATMHFGF